MSIVVAIDAGHGYNTAGKRCLKSIDPNQTREWFLNDRIADLVEQELRNKYNVIVLRTDDTTGAKDISLSSRVAAANNAKAALFISIHHNACIGGGSGGGTVVYYYSSLAARAAQAKKLYDKLIARTDLRGNRSQPVQKNGFYVIKKTSMPAFLIENGFMDSTTDTPIILTAEHARKTADAIVEFAAEQLSLKPETGQDKPQEQTKGCYPRCGAKYTTLAAALTSVGVNSTYAFRKKIAAANSINGYCGTAAQNTRMLNLLKAGILKKA